MITDCHHHLMYSSKYHGLPSPCRSPSEMRDVKGQFTHGNFPPAHEWEWTSKVVTGPFSGRVEVDQIRIFLSENFAIVHVACHFFYIMLWSRDQDIKTASMVFPCKWDKQDTRAPRECLIVLHYGYSCYTYSNKLSFSHAVVPHLLCIFLFLILCQ